MRALHQTLFCGVITQAPGLGVRRRSSMRVGMSTLKVGLNRFPECWVKSTPNKCTQNETSIVFTMCRLYCPLYIVQASMQVKKIAQWYRAEMIRIRPMPRLACLSLKIG